VTTVARVAAQAKINLLLRVLSRETSGYHAIETVFLRVDLGDDVSVRITQSGRSIDCVGPTVPSGGLGPAERNLAFRAALAYSGATGWPNGFAIEIEKRIPVGGGLGGGSADAGAVLRALDAMSPTPLGDQLPALGATLGADVPFMTHASPIALAWGRGERLLPLPALASRPVLLAVPDFSVATADAYEWLAAERGEYLPETSVLSLQDLTSWAGLRSLAINDFEPVVAGRHPVVETIVDDLRAAGAEIAMLTGSGSTVFGIFATSPSSPTIAPESGAQFIETRTSERVASVETA
jgi:4-diphosphocytidyl-2-C-methyl-D-erythritol kinase